MSFYIDLYAFFVQMDSPVEQTKDWTCIVENKTTRMHYSKAKTRKNWVKTIIKIDALLDHK